MSKIIFTIAYGKLWIGYIPIQKIETEEESPSEAECEGDSIDSEKNERERVQTALAIPPLKKERPPLDIPKHHKTQKKTYSRRICMCPIIQGDSKCRFEKPNNNSSLRRHDCPLLLHKLIAPSAFARPMPDFPSLPLTGIQDEAIRSLVLFFSHTPLSFAALGSSSFNSFAQTLIRLGQSNPQLPTTSILPYLTRQKIPVFLSQEANKLFKSLLKGIQGQFVSIMFDAGCINDQHYTAVCIQPLTRFAKPLFFQLTYGPWSKQEYHDFICQLLSALSDWSVHVTGICTDGLPAQKFAIEQVIEELQTHQIIDSIQPLFIPFHIYCFNHKINLIVERVAHLKTTTPIVEKLIEFAREANKKDFHSILKKACPSFIATRWLSLSLLASFIRLKRKDILEAKLLDKQTIHDALLLEIVLNPLMQLHLFFEAHFTKLCDVYPAILWALLQYYFLTKHPQFSHGEWMHVVVDIMVSLYNQLLCGNIGSQIELAFFLSPLGKEQFKSGHFTPAFNPAHSLQTASQAVFDRYSSLPFVLLICLLPHCYPYM